MSLVRFTTTSARLGASALLGLFSLSAHAQTGYSIQALGGLGTDSNHHVSSKGLGLNNKGQVVGVATRYNASHTSLGDTAFLFRNGTLISLSNFGTDSNGVGNSQAYGINDSGQVVGGSLVYDAGHNLLGHTGFLWQSGAGANPLGGFTTSLYTAGINNMGQVCGYAPTMNVHGSGEAAFLWQNNAYTNLGNFGNPFKLPGRSFAAALNNLGQVVGYSEVYLPGIFPTYNGDAAFLAQNGGLTNLGNLGTDSSSNGYSYATGINNLGQVVGYSKSYDTNHNPIGERAFLYNTTAMSALPTLGTDPSGSTSARAFGINDKGQIVGYSDRYDSNGNKIETDAVLWQGSTLVNLNDYLLPNSGWLLTSANAINNRGQITGVGIHKGSTEAFLLTPYIAGDFTRDGNPDILFQNSTTGDLSLTIMGGTARLISQPFGSNIPSEWKVVATPDLNGDGYADVVFQNTKTGDVAYWLLNNGRFMSYGYLYQGLPLNWQVVGSADFNSDGYPDLVLQDRQTGNIAVWYLSGTSYYDYGMIQSSGTGWQVVGVGDMNGDGQPDLLLRHKTNGDLYAWLLNGPTVSQGVFIANVPLEWNLVGLGDFGGDGNTSLLWQNSKSNDLYYWLMSGTTQTGNGLIQSGVPGWQVVGPR